MSVVVTERPARRGAGWVILILVLIALAALGYWFWRNSRPVPTRVVQRDIVGYVSLNGQIAVPPSARADIYPPFAAPVENVDTSIGKVVSRGDVLVTLSAPSADAQLAQAKQYLQAAETAYANARRQYAPRTVTTPGQTVTSPDGSTVATQPGQSVTVDNSAALVPFQQQLDTAREMYAQAKAGAKANTLRAPIHGTVLALNATPGQALDPNKHQPVVTIVNLDKIQAEAEMTPQQAAYVKTDMPVDLTVKEIPGQRFHGRVAQITSRVDEKMAGLVKQQRYVALVDFTNTDNAVKPGMTPVVAVKLGEVKDAVAVPADAISQDSSGRSTVKVMRGSQWQQVAVEPGLSDGQYTEVKSGLQKGEVVQVTPNPLSAASLPLPKK